MSVGQNAFRIDAVSKVTGAALYPGDLIMPHMAHMKILFARRPHAIVKAIDTSKAEQAPGVIAIFTAKDVPNNEYGLIMPDQPVLVGPGSNKKWGDHVRFIGDQIALVVAETEKQAEHARDLIEVEYEDLPVITDPREAMKDGALQLHPDKPGNLLQHYRIRKGDVDEVWDKCAAIVVGEYQTPFQEHAYLQPEAGLAYIDEEGRVTVQVAGQWTHEDQEQIAHALQLPQDQMRVIYPAIGGAFGGREDMSVQIVLALAAWRLRSSARSRSSGRAKNRSSGITSAIRCTSRRSGARAPTASCSPRKWKSIADAGAYAYTSTKVQGNCHAVLHRPVRNSQRQSGYLHDLHQQRSRRRVPRLRRPAGRISGRDADEQAGRETGHGPGRAAHEERHARRIDPVRRHADPQRRQHGRSGGALRDRSRLGEGRSSAGWTPPARVSNIDPTKRYGLGLAIGYKNVGFSFGAVEQSVVRLELRGGADIEEAIIYHAAAEVGQGTHTVMRQMTAEALGLPIEKVRLVVSDTASSGNSGSVSASRMTFMLGNSIRGAAELALKKWAEEERPAYVEYAWRAPKTTPYDPQTGKSEPNFAYGYVAEACEVEVDIETGHVRVLRVWCADDVGKAINPGLVRGQIEGAIVQAQGYTITENFQMKDGQVLTPYLSNYLIPTVLDVPQQVDSIILEYPDPIGPWGARGMGEMPYLPFAPAVCAAVKDAIGIWFDSFPLTPERVLKAIKSKAVTSDGSAAPQV